MKFSSIIGMSEIIYLLSVQNKRNGLRIADMARDFVQCVSWLRNYVRARVCGLRLPQKITHDQEKKRRKEEYFFRFSFRPAGNHGS